MPQHRKPGRPACTARRGLSAALAAVLAGAGAVALTSPAAAAPPQFPDNVVVFPDRDFVSIEGYQSHVGETATVKVIRAGKVVGQASSVVAAGDVAFEINHPGGVCWGAGAGPDLQVTPDIAPGDKVEISFSGDAAGDTIVSGATVTQHAVLDAGSRTLTVVGTVPDGVSHAQTEQRIVQPALKDTGVGRRDIRAVPGPLVPSDKGGYSSSLEFSGTSFTATYVFDELRAAELARDAGFERMMSWQVEDADGNRQGLTISEFGEVGGPGMGGCPAGPAEQAAPRPGTASVVRSADRTSLQVTWTAAAEVAGGPAVTGYNVAALASTPGADGLIELVGKRTGASVRRATITGLSPTESYTVELRSLAGARMSEAFAVSAAGAAPDLPADQTPPTLSSSPAFTNDGTVVEASSVTLSSDGQVYYTTDGSPAISGDMPSDSAMLYTEPIRITAQTVLHFAAFDSAGNTTTGFGTFAPSAAPVAGPAMPMGLTASSVGQEQVTLRWTAGDGTATGYQVTVYDAAGSALPAAAQPASVVNPTQVVAGLSAGTAYAFTVKARNAAGAWSDETPLLSVVIPAATDRLTVSRAKWKSGDFRVEGSGTVAGAVVDVRTGSASGPSVGQATVQPPAAPATTGSYTVRIRTGSAATSNPRQIWVTSDRGGVVGPITVTS